MTRSSEQAPAPTSAQTRHRDGHRVPDFFLVGHAKSGTTALYEMLRSHPQIFMPAQKEPWFLASDMRPRFPPRIGGLGPQNLDQYLALFAPAREDQRAGEASSSYLWSETAAPAVAALAPHARIVAILREPADFLRSLHLQLLQTHVENVSDLRRAVSLEGERLAGRHIPRRSHRPQLLAYSRFPRYVEQLQRYHTVFGREQVLVLIYEDFRADNLGALRSVLRHLDVSEDVPIDPVQANATVRLRSQALDEIVHAFSVGRGRRWSKLHAVATALTPQRLRRGALGFTQQRVVHGRPQEPDEEFLSELRRRFRPEVELLSEYLGRDMLSAWGYDRIA